jgi:parvulin-like peptidyl-prolyl isomerase
LALVINGQRVDDGLLGSEFASIKAYYESLGNVSCCERDPEFRQYAKENVTARVLLTQEALRTLGPLPEADVDAALEELKQQHGGEMQFLAAFGATTGDWPQIRRDLEVELRVKRMVDDLCAPEAAALDDAALRAYYDAHLDRFMTPEEVRASHILKSPSRGEDRTAAYQQLRDVRRRLRAGADFEETAKAHSDKANDHIDLGFFKRGELAEEFEVVAFSLEVGEISPVFASPFGYHVVTVTERKPPTPKPFDSVHEEVRELRVTELRQERTKELVKRLEASAVIEELADEEPADMSA